ncbi:MAG: hypothetical protein Greene041619_1045 [Candidatus Peregrinibacteria bacterium Greene0416_19]|nr:MAG: hypothetical protein Greene041619_1045 [Candidatus Peregrinibacteria bacterium Greene0416_19]
MAPLSPEKGLSTKLTVTEGPKLIVQQPQKLAELGQLLDTIDAFSNRVSERSSEDRSTDMGGGTSGTAGQGTQGAQISPRDQAIKNMPESALVLRQELDHHIEKEIKRLERDADMLASHASRPGAAYKLNHLYARIRRLRSLMHELVEAAVDLLRRLYIRVFIDKQPVL